KLSPAATSASPMARLTSSGYTDESTFLFGEVNPPAAAQISPASLDARNFSSSNEAGLSVSATATSPPPTTAGESPAFGNGKKFASVPTFAFVSLEITPATKSPSVV